ncbi:hypothetical protein SAMN05421736_101563 [Evansella caseinilytica]|uniref:Uncharacterized protein n=1 Tax=Evansella caseinilytica TaxID=1503961 RepID=A0A1H3HP06_9BACI|nr:hypothetical protein [Evansella caseinilytica]SDY17182.1 hypothetical protein SAMN05421736_101563 [Evansella caseinilytica]
MQEQPNDSLFASVEEWVYAQNNWRETVKEKGEHWLAPLHVKALNPREKMIFSNFNLTIPSSGEHRQYIIEGFLYTKEFQQGIPALNTISLTAI